MGSVEAGEHVELPALHGDRGMAAADVLDQLLHSLVLAVDVRALEHARQEARLPVVGALDRLPPRTHRHEARKVAVLRAQTIEHPRTHARPRLHRIAAVHQHQRRLVIGQAGPHRADDRQRVGVRGGALEEFADLQPAVAVPLEPKRAGERASRLPLGGNRKRQRLARILCQKRLRVEGVDVRRTAVEEELDHAAHARREVRRPGGQCVGGWRRSLKITRVGERRGQRDEPEASARRRDHLAAADTFWVMIGHGHQI